MEEKKVISIEELKKIASGELVDLPSFVSGETMTVRLRRPSLLQLVKQGKIPNDLLVEANKLFVQGTSGVASTGIDDPEMLTKMLDLIDSVCEEAFVEPKYSEIKAAGIYLTDSQRLAVFEYTQNGVANLKSFR